MKRAQNSEFSLPPIPSMRRQRLQHGIPVVLYGMGATPVRDFMQPLGATSYKVGLYARRYLTAKIEDLRLRRYASVVAPLSDRMAALAQHPLGNEWFLTRLPDPTADPQTQALFAQLREAEYVDGVIRFRLDPGLRLADTEKRFQRMLAPRNLNAFLGSEDGQARLREAGLPPDTRLFTDYTDIGRNVRRSLACELFLIRPQRELAVLLRALIRAIDEERKVRN